MYLLISRDSSTRLARFGGGGGTNLHDFGIKHGVPCWVREPLKVDSFEGESVSGCGPYLPEKYWPRKQWACPLANVRHRHRHHHHHHRSVVFPIYFHSHARSRLAAAAAAAAAWPGLGRPRAETRRGTGTRGYPSANICRYVDMYLDMTSARNNLNGR